MRRAIDRLRNAREVALANQLDCSLTLAMYLLGHRDIREVKGGVPRIIRGEARRKGLSLHPSMQVWWRERVSGEAVNLARVRW